MNVPAQRHPLFELLARYRAVFAAAWAVRTELAGPKLAADESAFLPAALALQATPVHPAPRRAAVVLCALFVLVFSMWWSYFDDIPDAGLPRSLGRMRGWVVGHLFLQVFLVGVAVGYAKLLRLDLGHNVDFDGDPQVEDNSVGSNIN